MKGLCSLFAATSLLASPVLGSVRDAASASSGNHRIAQTSIFAGATYRVSLDQSSSKPRGRASLKLAGMSHVPGSAQINLGDGLELTGGKRGRPALHLAGRDIGQLNRKAELDGTGTALIIGGVVLLAVVVALVASDLHHKNKCSEEEDC